jgi:isocitrate/isopropylmalate dehydrogenase
MVITTVYLLSKVTTSGPEVIEATEKVLETVDAKSHFKLNILYDEAGFHCIEEHRPTCPNETIELIKKTNACPKGLMTTPEEPGGPVSIAVILRRIFDLQTNFSLCRTFPNVDSCREKALKDSTVV